MTDVTITGTVAAQTAGATTIAAAGYAEVEGPTAGKWSRRYQNALADDLRLRHYIGTNIAGRVDQTAVLTTTLAETFNLFNAEQNYSFLYLQRISTGEILETVNNGPLYLTPSLTSASATVTGAGTATATVTPFTAEGTLYAFATTGGAPTAAQVIAGAQGTLFFAEADGPKQVPLTGLAESTGYTVYVVQQAGDGKVSNVISAGSITTDAGAQAPGTIATGGWSLAAAFSEDGDELSLSVFTPPPSNGAVITSAQYRVNGGTAITLASAGISTQTITVPALTSADVEIRFLNSVGAGPWSAAKSATPLQSDGSFAVVGTLTVGSTINISTPDPTLPHFMEMQVPGRTQWMPADTGTDPIGGWVIPPQCAGAVLRVIRVTLSASGQPDTIVASTATSARVAVTLQTASTTVTNVTELNAAIANNANTVITLAAGTYNGSNVVLTDRQSAPLLIQTDTTNPAVFTGELNSIPGDFITFVGIEFYMPNKTGGTEFIEDNGLPVADYDKTMELRSCSFIGPFLTEAEIAPGTSRATVDFGKPSISLGRTRGLRLIGSLCYNVYKIDVNYKATVEDMSAYLIYYDLIRAFWRAGSLDSDRLVMRNIMAVGSTGRYNERGEVGEPSAPHCDILQIINSGGPGGRPRDMLQENVVWLNSLTRTLGAANTNTPILQVSMATAGDTAQRGCLAICTGVSVNHSQASEFASIDHCYFRPPTLRTDIFAGGSYKFGAAPSDRRPTKGFMALGSAIPRYETQEWLASSAYLLFNSPENVTAVNAQAATTIRGPRDVWYIPSEWAKTMVANAPVPGTIMEGKGCLSAKGNHIQIPRQPDAPTYATPISTASSITVTVDEVAGARLYILHYKPQTGGTWTPVVQPSRTFNIIGLASGTTYRFQVCSVRSYEAGSRSAWTPEATVTTS